MASIPYKRVILKFSGEALAGEKQVNFDPDIIRQIAGKSNPPLTLEFKWE